MTKSEARVWIVSASLVLTFFSIVFFLTVPYVSVIFRERAIEDAYKMILPLFVGYLAAATQYVIQSRSQEIEEPYPLLKLLVIGPIIGCAASLIILVAVYWLSNAYGDQGMTPDSLTTWVSLILSVLAATSNVLVAWLFQTRRAR